MSNLNQLIKDLNIVEQIVSQHLGSSGYMLSLSKSGYKDSYPTNLVVFNSNICIATKKIWYGDLDITLSEDKLKTLAKVLEQPIYVLYESDARFSNEKTLKLDKYVYKTDGQTAEVSNSLKDSYNWELGTLQRNPKRLYHNKEFKVELKMPFLYKFIRNDLNNSPFNLFYNWIKRQIKFSKTKKFNPSAVYLLSSDYDELNTMCKIWAYRYKHIPEFRLSSSVAALSLDIGPMFIYNNETPDWAQHGHVYINMEDICWKKP